MDRLRKPKAPMTYRLNPNRDGVPDRLDLEFRRQGDNNSTVIDMSADDIFALAEFIDARYDRSTGALLSDAEAGS